MPERDPLDELRRAWRDARPPAPDAGAEDAGSDAATREAVSWMRAAWASLEAPAVREVPLPAAARRPRPAPIRSLRRRAPLAVAAGVAAAVAAAALLWRTAPPRALVPGGDLQLADAAPAAVADAPASAARGDVRIASLDADRMELRSGPVRLVLLTPRADRPRRGEDSDEPSREEDLR